MLNVLIGAALGFLSGLGVGGGSLLLLWLTAVVGLDHETARLMNLMFFLPCALIATLFRRKHSRPNRRLTLCAVTAGLIGAILGNMAGRSLDVDLLKKIFGGIFIACGIRELLYKPKQ